MTDADNDTRQKVNDPLQFPYSAIGKLSLNYQHGQYIGTGFLVGPNIVLTAAHNVYSR
jgi:V8-like Glu-specific endopeptidase